MSDSRRQCLNLLCSAVGARLLPPHAARASLAHPVPEFPGNQQEMCTLLQNYSFCYILLFYLKKLHRNCDTFVDVLGYEMLMPQENRQVHMSQSFF